MLKTRRRIAAGLATAAVIAAFAGSAGTASAACVAGVCTDTQVINGVPLATLALGVPAPSPFVFTSFGPGVNSSGIGTVLVTSTSGWTLAVGDHDPAVHTAGHMYKGGALCPAGAEAQTANPLDITAAGTAALGTASAGNKVIDNTDKTIATGAVTDLVSNTLHVNVGTGETMGTGCTYSTTLTYTLQ